MSAADLLDITISQLINAKQANDVNTTTTHDTRDDDDEKSSNSSITPNTATSNTLYVCVQCVYNTMQLIININIYFLNFI